MQKQCLPVQQNSVMMKNALVCLVPYVIFLWGHESLVEVPPTIFSFKIPFIKLYSKKRYRLPKTWLNNPFLAVEKIGEKKIQNKAPSIKVKIVITLEVTYHFQLCKIIY